LRAPRFAFAESTPMPDDHVAVRAAVSSR
jgi:hypothetical protein